MPDPNPRSVDEILALCETAHDIRAVLEKAKLTTPLEFEHFCRIIVRAQVVPKPQPARWEL